MATKKWSEIRDKYITPEQQAIHANHARRALAITSRPHMYETRQEEDGSWTGWIPEFEGVTSVGRTREEADDRLCDAFLQWIVERLEAEDRETVE